MQIDLTNLPTDTQALRALVQDLVGERDALTMDARVKDLLIEQLKAQIAYVARRRDGWQKYQSRIDLRSLVFIDGPGPKSTGRGNIQSASVIPQKANDARKISATKDAYTNEKSSAIRTTFIKGERCILLLPLGKRSGPEKLVNRARLAWS